MLTASGAAPGTGIQEMGMVGDLAAASVALSVGVYLSMMAVIFWRLVLEEPTMRRALAMPLLPMFLQNLGIPCGILAFALRATDLALVAVLLICLGLAAAQHDVADLHPSIELPLLIMAIGSFALIGVANLFA